jgi:hypothetical protein
MQSKDMEGIPINNHNITNLQTENKVQLILKGLFGVIVSTRISVLASKKSPNQKLYYMNMLNCP